MSNVVKLVTDLGDGAKIDADQILEANKGMFTSIVLVGQRADGSIAVAGSEGAGDSLLLLQWASQFLVNNLVTR